MWSLSSLAVKSSVRQRCHPSVTFSVTTLSLVMFPLHIISTSSVFASAFSPFAAAAAFSFFACAVTSSLSACAAAFFVAAVFYFNDLLVFFQVQPSRLQCCFLLGRVPHAQSCRVFLCILILYVLSRHGDRENSHDTSVATSHVDHVVGLGVFIVSQVSSLDQYVVNLFSFW